MKNYDNFKDFEKENKSLAIELLEIKGNGNWQNEEIYYHENSIDFAKYEVTDGWYADMITVFNGAPNLFDYIDYERLGNDLISYWDNSINYYSDDTGKIVVTSYGW